MKGKKGVATQSFNIMTAVIIMSVILIFGGVSVFKLINNAGEIEKAQFRTELESEIDSVSSKYGSVKYVELDGLKSYDAFCVFDLDKKALIESNFDSEDLISDYPLVLGDIIDETANVFLITDRVEQRFLNNKLSVSDPKGFSCIEIPSSGAVEIKLEGLGKEARFTFVDD